MAQPKYRHLRKEEEKREEEKGGSRERSDGRRFTPQSNAEPRPPTPAGAYGGACAGLVSSTLRAQNCDDAACSCNADRAYELGPGDQGAHKSLSSTEFLRLLLRLWRRVPGGDLPPRRGAGVAVRPARRPCRYERGVRLYQSGSLKSSESSDSVPSETSKELALDLFLVVLAPLTLWPGGWLALRVK